MWSRFRRSAPPHAAPLFGSRLTVDLLWVGLLALYAFAGYPLVPFHGDESTQLYMARDFEAVFVQHDLGQVRYSDPPSSAQAQFLRLVNGSLATYTSGLAAWLAGFGAAHLPEQYDWGAPYDYNVRTGHVPPPDVLQAARRASAAFTALAVGAAFLVGQAAGGRAVGYGMSLLVALEPTLLLNGRRAMMEGGLLAFSLLSVWAALLWARRGTWRWALLWGLCAGVALAAKHSALLVVFPAGVGALVAALLPERPRRAWRAFGGAALAALVALGVFVALNPVWWGNPVARATEVLELRRALLDGQAAAFGGYTSRTEALRGFWLAVFVGEPMVYEVADWRTIPEVQAQADAYFATPYAGLRLPNRQVVLAPLSALGLLALLGVLRLPQRDAAARWTLGAWALGLPALTLGLTPLYWQRYYLPVMPVVALLAVLGVVWLVRLVAGGIAPRTP